MVNANKHPDSAFISALIQTMSPADKIDSWFASTPAGPSQSATSRPNTKDTGMSSLAGDQSQSSNQESGDASFHSTTTDTSKRAPFPDPFLGLESQLPVMQMDGGTEVPGSSAADQRELSTSGLGTRDPFFDSVPKGPSQLSTPRWNTKSPAFDEWESARGHEPAPPWNKTETPLGPGKHPSNC